MEDAKTQVFFKEVTELDTQDGGERGFGGIRAVRREDHLGFIQVYFLTKKGAETV